MDEKTIGMRVCEWARHFVEGIEMKVSCPFQIKRVEGGCKVAATSTRFHCGIMAPPVIEEELHEVLAKRYDFVKHKKFWSSFLILFCFPLLVLLPIWASNESSFVSPKKLPICIETNGDVKDVWYCVPEELAYSLIYNFGVWPPFLWFLTFGNFIAFFAIKNAYVDFINERHARWEAATSRAGMDSVTSAHSKLKEMETLELDKKFRRLYFVCDPTCPKLRDALGVCSPDHVKKFRRLDENNTSRPILCRTCVCRKKWLYHGFAFFMFVFVPLGVLLPVWTQDRLKYHLDIDGPTGKTLWLVFTMLVASVWFVYLLYLQGQNVYAYYLRTYSPEAAAEREKHRRNRENMVVDSTDASNQKGGLLRRYCTKKILMWSFLTCLFFIFPLVIGLVCFYKAPDDFFVSSLSTRDARAILYIFAVAPPLVWFLLMGLYWTMDPASRPERFRTNEALTAAKKQQLELDDQFARSLRWPRWMMYEYPYWSIGTGLITTGERRAIRFYEGNQVNPRKFAFVWFLFFFVPVVILLPIYVEEIAWIRAQDLDSGIGENTLIAVIYGYPSFFTLFYCTRLLVNVLPASVKAVAMPAAIYLFIFVILPLGIIEPLVVEKYIYLSADTALLLRAIVYGLPSSLGGVLFSLMVLRTDSWWRWLHRLRIEESVQHNLVRALIKLLPYVIIIPIGLLVYGMLLLANWEDKNQIALAIFVVTDTVLQFMFSFLLAAGEISRTWIGESTLRNGIERLTEFLAILLSCVVGGQGAWFMAKWVGVKAPYIQDRIDEDDQELYVFVNLSVTINVLLVLANFYILYLNYLQSDYLVRFGHHPEDWELSDPSLLVRHMPRLVVQKMEELKASIRSVDVLKDMNEEYQSVRVKDGLEEEAMKHARQRMTEKYFAKRQAYIKGEEKKAEDIARFKKELDSNDPRKRGKGK